VTHANLLSPASTNAHLVLSDTPIYYTPLALHPGYTWSYFEDHWGDRPEWIGQAKKIVLDVWQKQYLNKVVTVEADVAQSIQATGSKRKYHDPFERDSHKKCAVDRDGRPRASRVTGDEYEAWLKGEDDHFHVDDPFEYWHERRLKYPRLSEMALDFLTIQPMSAECERLFSSAGQMMTPQRTALDAVILSICQCLRSWFRAGVLDDLDPLLRPSAHEHERLQKILALEDDEKIKKAASAWLNEPEDKDELDSKEHENEEALQDIFYVDEGEETKEVEDDLDEDIGESEDELSNDSD